MSLESLRRLIFWMGSLYIISMIKNILFFLYITADQNFKFRKNVVLQFIVGKLMAQMKSCVPCSIRTIYRWVSRFFLGGMENLRDR